MKRAYATRNPDRTKEELSLMNRAYIRKYKESLPGIKAHEKNVRRARKKGNYVALGEDRLSCIALYCICRVMNTLHGHNAYQIDHIVPLSQGGPHSINNLQLIVREAHQLKTAEETALHRLRTACSKAVGGG
jgi:5-methylcytosine-specific restriction endonuclease McrA